MKKGSLKKRSHRPKPRWRRHKVWTAVIVLLVLVIVVPLVMSSIGTWQTNRRQESLAPFYDTSSLPKDGPMGEVVRWENLGVEVPGGIGYRILYRSQKPDGTPTYSSGMVFSPYEPGDNKPVLAWAHGTLGLGDACTPSRSKNPASISFLSDAMQRGWVVVATDYAGQGTPGPQGYLIGKAEAQDVINSVRAARNMSQTNAGNQYVIWGHSQGGNSALFAASQSKAYAPELNLLGTVAAAPAAELVPLMNLQYDQAAGWVIGSVIADTWPQFNASLSVNDVLTSAGQKSYQKIANQCIAKSALGGLFRNFLRQKFFSVNPNSVPAWRQMAEDQTAPDLPPDQPLMVVESKEDTVVLPSTTALYIQQACSAGSNLQSLWIDKGSHAEIPKLTYSQVMPWIADRFNGQPNNSNCSQPPAVTPAQT